jgi:hypothetical protein
VHWYAGPAAQQAQHILCVTVIAGSHTRIHRSYIKSSTRVRQLAGPAWARPPVVNNLAVL